MRLVVLAVPVVYAPQTSSELLIHVKSQPWSKGLTRPQVWVALLVTC